MAEWFKDWFSSEDYLKVYQHRNYNDAIKLVDLIINQTKINSNAVILDAACGAGRHAIIFALKGFHVFGFDLSKNLLLKACEEYRQKEFNLNLVCGDLRTIYFKKKFDLVLSLFTSFGYFEKDEENFQFVRNSYEMLNPDKYYVLDYFNETFLRNTLVNETVKEIDGKRITEKRKITEDKVCKEIIIQDKGVEKKFNEVVKLYSRSRIINEFRNIGFTLCKIYGGYDGTEYNEQNSSRLVMFFKK